MIENNDTDFYKQQLDNNGINNEINNDLDSDSDNSLDKEIDNENDTTLSISLNNEDLTPAQLAEMAINSLFKDAQHDYVDIITPSKKITLEKETYEGVSANVDHANLLVFKFDGRTVVIISQEFVVEGYDI